MAPVMNRLCLMTLAALASAAACGGESSPGSPDAGPGGDSGPGRPDAGPVQDPDYIFDLDELHHFDIELADADWQWLKDNARLKEYRPATLIFEGVRYDAALRFKGGYGSLESCYEGDELICAKLSLKVSVNHYQNGRFYGMRALLFNSSVRDPSLMHEVVGYKLFRDMGVPAPRASHATLAVNGEDQGLFVLVEAVNKSFLQDRFGNDDGNLYKAVWPVYDQPEPYIEALRTNETIPDVSDMLALQQTIANSSDSTFASDMDGVLDTTHLARFLAVDRAISNSDGSSAFYCFGVDDTLCTNSNYYWYRDPVRGMVLFPWDLDYALYDYNQDLGRAQHDDSAAACEPVSSCVVWGGEEGCTSDIYLLPPQCDKLYGLMHRATWDQYLVELGNLADGPMSQEVIVPWMNAVRGKIYDAVFADPRGPVLLDYQSENMWLDELLAAQLTEIEKLLAE